MRRLENPEEGDREGHAVLEAVGQVGEALLGVVVPAGHQGHTVQGRNMTTRAGGATTSRRDHQERTAKYTCSMATADMRRNTGVVHAVEPKLLFLTVALFLSVEPKIVEHRLCTGY